jgi:hypothetical protein
MLLVDSQRVNLQAKMGVEPIYVALQAAATPITAYSSA